MTKNNLKEVLRDLSVIQSVRSTEATVFAALKLSNDEEWHSDIIAWFLNPAGPLTDSWLLHSLVKHIGCKIPAGVPRVLREVQIDNDIPDVVVKWPDFKILIENKTKSSEHSDQCKRYLKSFGIKDQEHGHLIFLNPSKNPWPKSVDRSDQRVGGLSYRDVFL